MVRHATLVAALVSVVGAGCDYFPAGLLEVDASGIVPDHGLDAAVDLRSDASWSDGPLSDAPALDVVKDQLGDTLPTGWWNASWSRRRKIVFNNAAQSTHLDSFPVLVKLEPATLEYAQVQPTGQDLRFVDADCTTVLPHEIESFTPGGASYVWVRVPRIDAGSKTDHIWLYYGNAKAADGQQKSKVWSAGYVGVFHLDADLKDSSASANHGTNKGSTKASGKTAGGRSFSFAQGDEIAIGKTGLPLGTTPRTICAWALPSALGTAGKHWFISYGKFENDGGFFIGRVGADLWCGGVGDDIKASKRFALNTWAYHCCVVEGANTVKLYTNGVLAAGPETHAKWSVTAGAEALIGGHINPTTPESWDGALDEVRISSKARSADWVRAQYLSMSGAFATIGPLEKL